MRHVITERLERARRKHPVLGLSPAGTLYGYFEIERPSGLLRIISSGEAHAFNDGMGEWEHVSVSLATRVPTWQEMCLVKDLFWDEGETVIQFHPPKSEYVNFHKFTLHLWKPPYDVPTPPTETIGPR